ncbi:MAG: hypothetical protein JJE30_19120 [Desulfuromonadales bacterium]|nr:hypothetical protein [Desulfuromonadales bacterium]
MKCKKAYLFKNPWIGKNVAKLTDMIAVFSAAGQHGVIRAKRIIVVT